MTIDEVHLLTAAIKNIGEPMERGHLFVSVYDIPAFEAAIASMIKHRDDYYASFQLTPYKALPIDNEYKAFLETLAGPYGKVVWAAYCKKHNVTRRITWGNRFNASS